MTIIEGNLWDELGKADVILITTNSTLRGDGALVMGRGAAKEAIERFPSLPYNLGRKIKEGCKSGGVYSCMADRESMCGKTMLAAFQVKYHWRDEADLELIRGSAERLTTVATKRPHQRFALNFPGIGNGRLRESDVLPLLQMLPDNVFVYRFKP